MTGCAAVVLSSGNPHVYQEFHEGQPDWDLLRHYWDGPILFAPRAEKKYFIKVCVAVGISSMMRWDGWEKAVEALPDYLNNPHVYALGEIGVDPWQYWGYHWPVDEQKEALEGQIRAAKEADVPVILHTPTQRKGFMPEMTADEFKLHFLEHDMEVINRVGFDHRRLLIDHADDSILDYALEETDAYIGIGVGVRLRHTNPFYFADVVERYGPERLMINTDYLSSDNCDMLAIPRAVWEMRRRGLEPQAIRQTVFDNANELFRLGLEA
jgi:predicted metal-dependent TIM-barrel fold hydrolase